MWPALLLVASLLSLQPDGHGGLTAFVLFSNKVLAVPIDESGSPRTDRIVTLLAEAPEDPSFGIAPTTAGYMMTFHDVSQIAWAAPLGKDFAPAAPRRAFGRGTLAPLACHADRCAAIHLGDPRLAAPTLLLMDAAGSPVVSELPVNANLGGLAAIDDGFVVIKATQELALTFVNHTGQVTATTILATKSDESFYGVAIATHPLGVAVFWPDESQVAAAIVRPDGAIVARAAFPAPDLEVSGVHVAHGGGQYGLEVNTVVEPGVFFPQNPNNHPPVLAATAMRVSESLSLLEAPVKLAPAATSSVGEGIVASGDGFWAVFSAPAYRILRIPFSSVIEPGSSKPLSLTPPSRKHSVTH